VVTDIAAVYSKLTKINKLNPPRPLDGDRFTWHYIRKYSVLLRF
jgi:hypothetical protein